METPATIADTATAAAATDVVITYAATAKIKHIIDGLICSYNGTPTSGRVRIAVGGNTVFDVDITAGGPAPIPIVPGIEGGVGEAVVITLSSGGSGIVGKLNVRRRKVFAA